VTDIASIWERACAHSIDAAIVCTLAVLAGVAFGDIAHVGRMTTALAVLVALPLAGFVYSVPAMLRRGEHRGQSLGKHLVGIRVVSEAGDPIGLQTLLLRECVLKWIVFFGPVSVVLLWMPAIVTVVWAVTSKSNRAPHDLLAHTNVVRTRERAVSPAYAQVVATRAA
jgi:uncharacterized RDD family membrane protein YckC